MKRAVHRLAAVVLSCLAMFAGLAEACMVCIPFPQNTVADHLLAANVVVLARENPQKPFSYAAVEILKGDLDTPDIDLFLNSTTRRRLALNPDRSVILALGGAKPSDASRLWRSYQSPADASSKTWQSLGYATTRYEALVRDILANAPRWRGRSGREGRTRYFMRYLADGESPIRELAYLEVGRAPYDTILEADRFVPADQVRAFLANQQYIEWRSLYILLLGVDAKPHEQAAIREAMARLARFDQKLNLSAWATALIEIDGEAAIDWLETAYLGAPERDSDVVLEVVKALSVHGAREQSALRERIAGSYGTLIEVHPALAGWVASDLTSWTDWRFAAELGELRESPLVLDSSAAYAIDFYVERARSHAAN